MGKVDKSTLESFEAELRNPEFTAEQARTEFYTLAKGVTSEMEEVLLSVLERYHPGLVKMIREELELERA